MHWFYWKLVTAVLARTMATGTLGIAGDLRQKRARARDQEDATMTYVGRLAAQRCCHVPS